MTPLLLELEGFTCFRERARIDWEGVDSALFAVTGPTGAGKSTLLDAITYAIYGRTPRLGSRGLAGLISPGAEQLVVRLEFRTARGVFRVTRSAQRSASGASTEVRIERAADGAKGWKQLDASERVRDANDALVDIVGLDYEGFTRAVLLPQGAFDEFLRGDAGLRRQLLSSLLGLERVEQVRQLASSKSSVAEAELGAKRSLLEGEYADAEPRAVRELKGHVEELEGRLGVLQAERSTYERELELARQLGDLARERESLAAARSALATAEADIATTRARLELAQRARAVQPQLEALARLEARARGARAKVEEAETGERDAAQALRAAQDRVGEAERTVDDAVRRIDLESAALTAARPALELLTTSGGDLRMARQATSEAALDAGALARLRTASSLVAPYGRALEATVSAVAELVAATRAAETARAAHERVGARLAGLLQDGKALRAAQQEAQARLDAALSADMAAALRAGLGEDDDCPVCGRPMAEHLGAGAGTHGGTTDLEAARAAADTATAAVDAALSRYHEAERDRARQEAALEAAERRAAAAATARDAAAAAVRSSAADLRAHGVQVAAEDVGGGTGTGLAGEAGELTAGETAAELKLRIKADVAAALAAHALLVERQLGEFGAAVRTPAGLDSRLRELAAERTAAAGSAVAAREEAARLERQLDAAGVQAGLVRANLTELLTELDEAQAATGAALNSAGFESAGEAAAAQATDEEMRAAEAALQEHAAEIARVDGRTVEVAAALAALPGPAELLARAGLPAPAAAPTAAQASAALADAAARATAALQDGREELGDARGRLRSLTERLERARELRSEVAELEAKHELFRQLALDLRGNRFPDYLLSKVQQMLARRASSILRQVTDGRFDLRLTDGDYLVSDAWAGGEVRSARTLSGGESFVASLALALALSDTLAGNAALGALFLDEGFGTLDAETLESVTGVLESLAQQGRMVGVITHVTSLSDRLPARLVVTKGQAGSRVEWDQ